MTSNRSRLPSLPGALAFALAVAFGVPSAVAHEGEDHSQPAAAATPVADPAPSSGMGVAPPRREADGSVFLPEAHAVSNQVRTKRSRRRRFR